MFCTNCGKESKENESFCSGCGTKLIKDDQSEMERFYKLTVGKEPTSQAMKDALKKVSENTKLVEEMQSLEKKASEFLNDEISKPKETIPTPLWKQIIDGDWGLAKTFWVFGVGIFILLALLWQANQSYSGEITLFYLMYAIYSFFAALAVGRAAYKYQGLVVWKVLVLIYTFFILLFQPLGFLMDLTGL